MPGLAGFWGEFPAVLSTFNPGGDLSQPLFRTYMVIAAIGTVLAAGYLLWMLQKVAFGVPKPEFADAHIHDVSSFEWTAWVPILLLIVGARRLPEPHLPGHRRRGDVSDRGAVRVEDDRPGLAVAQVPGVAGSRSTRRPPRRSPGADVLLAATAHIPTPTFDWHAFAPDLVLVATMVVVLVADLVLPDRESWRTSSITAVGLLGALIPIATLAHDGHDRVMFGGAYVVDHYALALKAFFIVAALHHRAAVGRLHRRGRLLQRRVLLPVARRRRSA